MYLSYNHVYAMRYGVHITGSHVHVKLRYKADIADAILSDKQLLPYLREITVIFNKKRTHAHLAFIAHVNTELIEKFKAAERQYRKKLSEKKC